MNNTTTTKTKTPTTVWEYKKVNGVWDRVMTEEYKEYTKAMAKQRSTAPAPTCKYCGGRCIWNETT